MEQSYDFFISYNRYDKELANSSAMIMREYGAKVWIQESDSNQIYSEEIIKSIKVSKNFVIFISNNSLKSTNVFRELKYACDIKDRNSAINIIPIELEDTDYTIEEADKYIYYLSVFNILKYSSFADNRQLVSKIFESAKYVSDADKDQERLYASSDKEKERIALQNKLMSDETRDILKKIFASYSDSSVNMLDIGCGDGSGIKTKLKGFSYKSLVGIDKAEDVIQSANKTFGDYNTCFIQCDILSDEFNSIIDKYQTENGIDGFDVITMSSVALHITDLEGLFGRVYRLLKKGGFLLIQEEDDGCNLVYPESKFFNDCFYLYKHSLMAGDRMCARKIPSILQKFDYSEVKIEKCGISSLGMTEEEKEALWNTYFNPFLWGVVDDMLFDDIRCKEILKEYRGRHNSYKEEYDKGNIFIQLGFLFFLARK